MLPRTQRQKEVLDYITRFLASHGHEPSYAQIARHFGVSSKAHGKEVCTVWITLNDNSSGTNLHLYFKRSLEG
jgi:SOS-response transcriptional repressor LexA